MFTQYIICNLFFSLPRSFRIHQIKLPLWDNYWLRVKLRPPIWGGRLRSWYQRITDWEEINLQDWVSVTHLLILCLIYTENWLRWGTVRVNTGPQSYSNLSSSAIGMHCTAELRWHDRTSNMQNVWHQQPLSSTKPQLHIWNTSTSPWWNAILYKPSYLTQWNFFASSYMIFSHNCFDT